MKVAVTGGAGFIGSNFVRYLTEERPNWQVSVLDLLTYAGNLENVADLVDSGKVSFSRVDVADFSSLASLFESAAFELVFHFAAESHVDRSIENAQNFVKTNVVGTQNLISCCKSSGVRRLVHISTDEVYGSLGPTGRFVETTPLDPTSPYAASKAASDLMVLAACKTHGFDAVVTRCTNNYGPYQFPEKLVPLFITNAMEDRELPLYGDGMNVRSWLYVRDHCEALVAVGERGRSGEVYNIGGMEEAELPNREVTELILEHLKKPASLIKPVKDRPAHDRRYAIDYSKMKQELGWMPRTPFKDGLAQTIDWYQANAEWWRRVKSGEYQEFYERNYAGR